MSSFEIIISFVSSGIFLALLAMFYRMGSHHKEVELRFQNFETMKDDIKEIRKDLSRMDREIAVITATLRFNGFDLDRHKAQGE